MIHADAMIVLEVNLLVMGTVNVIICAKDAERTKRLTRTESMTNKWLWGISKENI